MYEKNYALLATALRYPETGFQKLLIQWGEELQQEEPEALKYLEEFLDFVRRSPLETLQETYTRTFEIQALCHLDLGYVLFGEDYKRGQFLVGMKFEHGRAGNPCGAELPDHLPNILDLLPKMKDPAVAGELVHTFVLAGVEKMLESFHEGGNVYAAPLHVVRHFLEKDFSAPIETYAQVGGQK